MKVTITRAQNGWILEEDKPFEYDEGTYLSQEVFEDEEHENKDFAQANSLANLLWAAFQPYFQTKWNAGLTIDVSEKGREEEFMQKYEEEYSEEDLDEYRINLPDDSDPAEAFRDFYPVKGDQMPETD
jgi:hypothetical protein